MDRLRRLQQSKLYRYVTTNTSSHWASSFLTDMSLSAKSSRKGINFPKKASDIKANSAKYRVKM